MECQQGFDHCSVFFVALMLSIWTTSRGSHFRIKLSKKPLPRKEPETGNVGTPCVTSAIRLFANFIAMRSGIFVPKVGRFVGGEFV